MRHLQERLWRQAAAQRCAYAAARFPRSSLRKVQEQVRSPQEQVGKVVVVEAKPELPASRRAGSLSSIAARKRSEEECLAEAANTGAAPPPRLSLRYSSS